MDGSLYSGERQVAASLDGIRRDHRARYEWAARVLPKGPRVLDVACGVGYGSRILTDHGHDIFGVDRSAEAIEFGRRRYYPADRQRLLQLDITTQFGAVDLPHFGAAVCFEIIEHLADPLPMLCALAGKVPVLLASVPNEKYLPYQGQKFHFRHYTEGQFCALLQQAGYRVDAVLGQVDTESEVEEKTSGRTIVVRATSLTFGREAEAPKVPEHVVILGLGPSLNAYVLDARGLGARKAFADEVWGINAVGDILNCDRIFHMDDVRIQEIRASARPKSNIANMLKWLRTHPGPIYTSQPHPDYPGLVAYPLEEVINSTGYSYFNNTAPYAVALAIHLGVKKLTVLGCDYTYPNAHHAERGRACMEFWLGIAAARGIEIVTHDRSTLLDGCYREKPYGYDCVDLTIERRPSGLAEVSMTPIGADRLPSADDVEHRYDHSRHPNLLVEKGEM